ncbi:MAG: hypothetical protein AAGN35_27835 [Bacteroidota bacterium]
MKPVTYINALAFGILAAFLLGGCAQFEDVITNKEGTWRTTQAKFSEYENGTLVDEQDWDAPEIMVFYADGTGEYRFADGTVDTATTITWSYDAASEAMTINESTTFSGGSVEIEWPYTVIRSKKNAQSWKVSDEETTGGTTYLTEITLELERVD